MSPPSDAKTDYGLKFYGRRKGKTMRTTKTESYEEILPAIEIRLDSFSRLREKEGARDSGKDEGPDTLNWQNNLSTIKKAQKLRKIPTEAENLFWQKVRSRQIAGAKFRRQFPIGKYFADFVCLEKMLIVEIDGGQHTENQKDEQRTLALNELGYEVVRFWNNDVLQNIDGVLEALTLTLSRRREREKTGSFSRLRENVDDKGFLDPTSFFDFTPKKIWMEIGFGDGEHLLHHAINNPDIGMIGCEPFINGIAALCVGIREHNLKNIRIWPDDARLFMPKLASGSIDRLFLLNSDPWPKTRHHKRRFIQQETLDEIHRLLKPGAEFRMSSDHASLTAWQLEKAYFHGGFDWQAKTATDWSTRPDDLPETRYQSKGLKQGRQTTFLNFHKKDM